LTNTPATPLTTAAIIIRPALVNTLTTPKISEEDMVTITVEETVERDMVVMEFVVMDIRSMATVMPTEMAREKRRREEDRRIGRVGGGELRLCWTRQYERMGWGAKTEMTWRRWDGEGGRDEKRVDMEKTKWHEMKKMRWDAMRRKRWNDMRWDAKGGMAWDKSEMGYDAEDGRCAFADLNDRSSK
jgi:hypothetical protein